VSTPDTSSSEGPFTQKPLSPPQTWFERFFHRPLPGLAAIAIENLLVDRGPATATPTEISEIANQYSLTGPQVRNVACDFYRRALRHFVQDDIISDQEASYLSSLRLLLTLTNQETSLIESEVVHPRYDRALSEVLADRKILEDEAQQLKHLSGALRLSADVTAALMKASVIPILTEEWKEIAGDKRISPIETERFEQLAKDLQTSFELDPEEKAQAALYTLYWQVENGQLPTFQVPIVLQKNETCHYYGGATWYEIRTKTDRVNYAGPTYRLRIAKGLYYRIGSMKVDPIRRDYLTQIGQGTIYFTNKRIIFDGSSENKTIRLSALIGFEPYSDGVKLEKATGRSPTIILAGNAELAAMILSEILARA
jgi:hypothetical protein